MKYTRYLGNHLGYVAGTLIVAASAYIADRESFVVLSPVLWIATGAMIGLTLLNWLRKFKDK